MIEFVADDALATAAALGSADPTVERVVLCTPDKDLAQMVQGQRIVCLDRRRRTILDEPGVRQKFGVGPASIPDWLALVGDTADGIPGIPRWGERSAGTVLARYERLEAIPRDAGDWEVAVRGAAALAESLDRERDNALLYRTLATLRTDVPLAADLESLRWRGVDRDQLAALCREIAFERFLEGL
jgi:5'-3' exonuclease